MPQGRKKMPFSGKAKKEQLKSKKQRKASSTPFMRGRENNECLDNTNKINFQSKKDPDSKTNKYALMFRRETENELRLRKEIARQSLVPVTEKELEIDARDYFPEEFDFPKRPEWSYELTKEELESNERKYFNEYLGKMEKNFTSSELGFFELNLETWRQLWRVIEMSDIILYILDIRFSNLMFPPSLYEYVTKELKKDFILVINKIDLAPAPLVVAWKSYFQEMYPDIHIVMFTSMPSYNLFGKQSNKGGLQVRRRRGRIHMAAEGAQTLLNVCKSIVGSEVDLSSWEQKIQEEMNADSKEAEQVEVGEVVEQKSVDTSFYQHERFNNGMLTIGCVGYPNVGKSSLMNALKGKKIVSVSRTPGHTKYFQTIFLTPNVRLCDCPGLVFPSRVPRMLQVLMGSFPIAQLREPYTTVKFLAERLNLQKLLRIEHPEQDDTWSAMDICDGWSKKRGFVTAKAARLDSYRGANSLLRMALDGKICLCFRPPKYHSRTDFWSNHPEVQKVLWIQAKSDEETTPSFLHHLDSSDEASDTEIHAENGIMSSENEDESSDDESDLEIQTMTNKFSLLRD
ncbi:guanine nucleotide-binding protein-like 1 [Coccinella septempunctata]|uniref:guanine nucleotide-binding protein-like 1 n=1 Tax=Coccinella septempunctata TaxID=41139 RepID=UPI001D084D30|nr:guanine nucleotide-binding protein-like 1 [Coccinella septempunctata]